jgi:hypothetical protein
MNDYEVQLQPKGGSGTIKVVIRATSVEHARQQAVAQYPNHNTVAMPRKIG